MKSEKNMSNIDLSTERTKTDGNTNVIDMHPDQHSNSFNLKNI